MNRKYLIKALTIAMAVTAFISVLLGILSVIGKDTEYIDMNEVELVQLQEIEDGAPIAIITTSLGEIKAVLYPEYAPNTVENFIENANNGFYDGTYIYSVSKERQFIAGAQNPDGTGSDDNDDGFDSEIHNNLWPFKGAFISLNSKGTVLKDETSASGDRFIVCGSIEMTDEAKSSLLGDGSDNTTLAQAFIDNGGIPNYSRMATVFAQTYEGMDVVDAILSVETSQKKPKEDIIIESVVISQYSSEDTSDSANEDSNAQS